MSGEFGRMSGEKVRVRESEGVLVIGGGVEVKELYGRVVGKKNFNIGVV